MVKNILFLVNRNLYYRHYGPFIDYFLNLGHNLNLLHDYSHARDGVKGSYFPALNSVPDFKGKISFYGIYKTKNDIISFIKENSIDFVFSLNSYNYYDIDKVSIEPSKWVCLQHWADNFQYGPIEPFSCDHFLSYSKYWWDSFIRSDYHKDSHILKPKIHHIGHPLNYLIDKLDRDYIKKKYNIPLDKKVLTYLPIGPAPMYIFQTVYQKLGTGTESKKGETIWVDTHVDNSAVTPPIPDTVNINYLLSSDVYKSIYLSHKIDADTWTHVAFVYDRGQTERISIYINGEYVAQTENEQAELEDILLPAVDGYIGRKGDDHDVHA